MATLTEVLHRESPHLDAHLSPLVRDVSPNTSLASTCSRGNDTTDEKSITDASFVNEQKASVDSHSEALERGEVKDAAEGRDIGEGHEESVKSSQESAIHALDSSHATSADERDVTDWSDDVSYKTDVEEALAATDELIEENEAILQSLQSPRQHDDVSKFDDLDLYPVPTFPKIRLAARREEIKQRQDASRKEMQFDEQVVQHHVGGSTFYDAPADVTASEEEDTTESDDVISTDYVIEQLQLLEEFDVTTLDRVRKGSAPASHEMYAITEDADEEEAGSSDVRPMTSSPVFEEPIAASHDTERQERQMREEVRLLSALQEEEEVRKEKKSFATRLKEKLTGRKEEEKSTVQQLLQKSSKLATASVVAPLQLSTRDGDVSETVNRKSIADELNDVYDYTSDVTGSTNDSRCSNGCDEVLCFVEEPVVRSEVTKPSRLRAQQLLQEPSFDNPNISFSSSHSHSDLGRHLPLHEPLNDSSQSDPTHTREVRVQHDDVTGFDDYLEALDLDLSVYQDSDFKLEPFHVGLSNGTRDGDVDDVSRYVAHVTEDKCVGTTEVFEPVSEEEPRFSQRIVVSRFSREPIKTPLPMTQTTSVHMIIEDGKIRDIHNADVIDDERSKTFETRFEAFEVNPTLLRAISLDALAAQHQQHTSRDQNWRAASFVDVTRPEVHPNRTSRDSGYLSQHASVGSEFARANLGPSAYLEYADDAMSGSHVFQHIAEFDCERAPSAEHDAEEVAVYRGLFKIK